MSPSVHHWNSYPRLERPLAAEPHSPPNSPPGARVAGSAASGSQSGRETEVPPPQAEGNGSEPLDSSEPDPQVAISPGGFSAGSTRAISPPGTSEAGSGSDSLFDMPTRPTWA